MSCLSIDIGMRNIAAVEGQVASGNIIIDRAALVPLDKDVVIDGVIKNSPALCMKLMELVANNGFSSKKAIVTINAGNVMVREFQLPNAKAKELSAMVRNEMIASYSANETDVIEYIILDKSYTKLLEKVNIRAMALNADIVSDYHKALEDVRLKPIAMDIHTNAIEKLVASGKMLYNGQNMEGKNILLLDFGYSGIMIYAICGGIVNLSRFIPLGISDLAGELINNMVKKESEVSKDFLETIDVYGDDGTGYSAGQCTRNFLTQCVTEVQKVIMYIVKKLPDATFANIFIMGGGSAIPGIDRYFSEAFSANAQILMGLSNVQFRRMEDAVLARRYLNAAGALIRTK